MTPSDVDSAPVMKLRAPVHRSRSFAGSQPPAAFALALVLFLSMPRHASAEDALTYKYGDYREEGGRMHIKTHNVRADIDLGPTTKFSAQGVMDTITGATPSGEPAPAGSDQVVLTAPNVLHDIRRAVTTDLTHVMGLNTLRGEFAYSKESDYLSHGYSATYVRDLNEKNTQLQFGFSYTTDSVKDLFLGEWRPKTSRDFIIGVTQLLSPNATLTANLSYGNSSGYLNDPYRITQKLTPHTVLIGTTPFTVMIEDTFPENRPSSREKWIGYLQLENYFEKANGSLESSLRYFRDDQGIDSATVELAWFQKLGTHWIIRPAVRYYTQTAADYYYYNLDNTSVVPPFTNDTSTGEVTKTPPSGNAPFYSSDYRLSKFDATTLGLKIIYNLSDRWSVDAMYERYEMRGRDGVTPQSAYMKANILTGGFRFSF